MKPVIVFHKHGSLSFNDLKNVTCLVSQFCDLLCHNDVAFHVMSQFVRYRTCVPGFHVCQLNDYKLSSLV